MHICPDANKHEICKDIGCSHRVPHKKTESCELPCFDDNGYILVGEDCITVGKHTLEIVHERIGEYINKYLVILEEKDYYDVKIMTERQLADFIGLKDYTLYTDRLDIWSTTYEVIDLT